MNLARTLFLLLNVKCPDAVHARLTEGKAVTLDESVSADAFGETPVLPPNKLCDQGTVAGQHMVNKWWDKEYGRDCNDISDLTNKVIDALGNGIKITSKGEEANNCAGDAARAQLASIQAQCPSDFEFYGEQE